MSRPRHLLFALIGVAAVCGAAAQSADTASFALQTRTQAGGLLQVETAALNFDLSTADFPSVNRDTFVVPTGSASFRLTAAGLPGRNWMVRVSIAQPLVANDAAYVLPNENVQLRIVASTPNQPPGCVSTPRDTWLPIGDGEPVVVNFRGGGRPCRLSVFMRIKAAGAAPPGTYQGVLSWAITSETP